MPTHRRIPSLLAFVVLLLAGCQAQGLDPEATPTAGPTSSSAASVTPRPSATPRPTSTPAPTSDLTQDPFTVLVLGADHEGRTDAVMVVGIDVVGRTISLASIPRDTINVPLPGGGIFENQKINAFWNHAAANPGTYPAGPARATVDMVGLLLGIEIDYYARTTFRGFEALIDAIGGVKISLPKALSDPYYQITTTQIGVKFPAGAQTLDGKRALIFVRTRQADNDFERQRRQQAFLLAAGRQILANPGLLAALVGAQSNIQTDFPIEQLPALLTAVDDVSDWRVNQVVLGPARYESAASCPCGYALAPKLAEFAKLAAIYYPWAVRQ